MADSPWKNETAPIMPTFLCGEDNSHKEQIFKEAFDLQERLMDVLIGRKGNVGALAIVILISHVASQLAEIRNEAEALELIEVISHDAHELTKDFFQRANGK
jgi:hypothetical protein